MSNPPPTRGSNVQLTVGIAEMKVSKGAEDLIITHALGSCLGITAYDPMTRVGGMLHAMLPQGSLNADKAVENPYMFVDTGFPRLLEACLRSGAAKNRLIITVAGGAAMKSNGGGDDFFQIGKRNIVMLRKTLWAEGIMLKASDVGGGFARTLTIEIATGEVVTRTGTNSTVLLPAKNSVTA
jgi:chemotaxis protein CheD